MSGGDSFAALADKVTALAFVLPLEVAALKSSLYLLEQDEANGITAKHNNAAQLVKTFAFEFVCVLILKL